MFDWLFEGRQSFYIALGALAAVVAALWAWTGFVLYRSRAERNKPGTSTRRRLAVLPMVLGLLSLLAGVYFVLDRLVETKREQIERKLQEMAGAVRARNLDGIFAHISERFNGQRMNKSEFRAFVDPFLRDRRVDDLKVWDVTFPDDTGSVQFRAKVTGPGIPDLFWLVRGAFVHDSDGQWRLQTFDVFQPFSDSQTPVDIRSQR